MANEEYMLRAIELAKMGCGHTNPNPMVGAVIVKDGQIIGEGYHAKYGDLHAERNALANCKEDCTGATMYVTLEPCCHHGKQPPCTDAVIASGINEVYVGSADPNPQVSGKGVALLRDAGITVHTDYMREECDAINPVFFHYITTGLPYVVMKYAMTRDGKLATRTGASKWITGDSARHRVQEDRNRYASILVGIGTVLADDPSLTCRLPGGNSPARIICDSKLRIPLDCQIVKTAHQVDTIIATCTSGSNKIEDLRACGCQVAILPEKDEHVDLMKLMEYLGNHKIDSVYIEGGSQIHWSAIESGIVSRVQTYIAPKIFGGSSAPSPIAGLGYETPNKSIRLTKPTITFYDDDILMESEVIKCSQE